MKARVAGDAAGILVHRRGRRRSRARVVFGALANRLKLSLLVGYLVAGEYISKLGANRVITLTILDDE